MPTLPRRHSRDLALVIVLVLVAAGLIAYLATRPSDSGATGAQSGPQAQQSQSGDAGDNPLADLPRRIDDDPLALGPVDAPVTLVVYSDFRCPFCAKYSTDIEPELVDRYVDSGTLRIEWRDFPIFGEQSLTAARAARAAAEQGRFWEYTRVLYADAPPNGHPDLTTEKLHGFAREAGITDLDAFSRDAAGAQYDESINADIDEGSSLGVSSTPTFVVNGRPIVGAQPVEVFTSTIEQAAAES